MNEIGQIVKRKVLKHEVICFTDFCNLSTFSLSPLLHSYQDIHSRPFFLCFLSFNVIQMHVNGYVDM